MDEGRSDSPPKAVDVASSSTSRKTTWPLTAQTAARCPKGLTSISLGACTTAGSGGVPNITNRDGYLNCGSTRHRRVWVRD